MSNTQRRVRGTVDILPCQFKKMHFIRERIREISSFYGFKSMDIPIMEYTSVFSRTLGDTSDIVSKEMYTFQDRKGESITLRPEFTAGITRCLISNKLYNELPMRIFTTGSLFRYERPQKGRQREFHQINAEIIGENTPESDVEIIALAHHIFKDMGISDKIALNINSLGDEQSYKNYRQALIDYLTPKQNSLSELSRNRLSTNPIRILDSKEKEDIEIIQQAPDISEYYSKEASKYFESVISLLKTLGIDYYINNKLVRGLDYYSHTVFEFITTDLGSQGTVIAGGRYDGLSSKMGGKPTPAIGMAGGLERLIELVNIENRINQQKAIALIPTGKNEIDIIKILPLAQNIRYYNHIVRLFPQGNLSKILGNIVKSNEFSFAIIIGEDELKDSSVTLKNLKTSQQEIVKIDSLIQKLAKND